LIEGLKKALRSEENENFLFDAILENASEASDEVRDAFLDDIDYVVIGAENDPEIKALVETIPEYSGSEVEEAEVEQEISTLVENLAATVTKLSPQHIEELKREINKLKAKNERLRGELEFFRKRGNTMQSMRCQREIEENERRINRIEEDIRNN
jgi:predicted RNase H-like nuclease (RuvC/YqgF family)